VIVLTLRRRLLPTSGRHAGVPYNVVILRHIRGFLVYIDGSFRDTSDVITVAVVDVLSVRCNLV